MERKGEEHGLEGRRKGRGGARVEKQGLLGREQWSARAGGEKNEEGPVLEGRKNWMGGV